MKLVKRKPWAQFFADPIFTDLTGSSMADQDELFPAINIIENEKSFDLELAVPGFGKDDFNVDIDQNRLTVHAENKKENEEDKKNFWRRDFSYKSFTRSFLIPENANAEKVKATYENGLLHLQLEKKMSNGSEGKRKIDVK